MNVDFGEDRSKLVVDSTEVSLPSSCSMNDVVDDVVVCLLSTDSGTSDGPDFDSPERTRNVVGIRETGERAWTIEPYPDPTDSRHYVRVSRFHDRCVCRRWAPHSPANWVAVDPRSGPIVETYPLDTFRIGGDLRQFPRGIQYFFTFDGIGFVIEDSDRGTVGNFVTAFDESEDERWRRQFESGWLLEQEGKLLPVHEPSMGANTDIRHDPATGEPVAIHRSVFETREHLETSLPRSLRGLIDDYLRAGNA